MIYTVKPIAARLLKSGDTFRDGGCTHRVIEVDHSEITYSAEPSELVSSFFARPDDIVDLIIDRAEDTASEGAIVLKKGAIKALADEFLNINRAVNTIIRIAADNGADPFQDQ